MGRAYRRRHHPGSHFGGCPGQAGLLSLGTMHILLAGATGVVGRRIVPLLVAKGHQVTGLTRSPSRGAALAGHRRGAGHR